MGDHGYRPATSTAPAAPTSSSCAPSRTTARGGAAGAATSSTARGRCCRACAPSATTSTRRTFAAPCNWLKAHQNPDGGWGESLRSYDDERWAGRGESTPVADGVGDARPARRRARASARGAARRRVICCARRSADGTWNEEPFTGTGFPRHFYLRYDMYRNYFPLMALGQFRARLDEGRRQLPRATARGAPGPAARRAHPGRARRGATLMYHLGETQKGRRNWP